MYYAIDQGVLYRWDVDADDWVTETHDNTAHSETYAVDGDTQPPETHDNTAHSENYTTLTEVNNNADVPEADNADTVGGELPSAFADTNHDNTEHSLTFVSDGDGIERQIWIIANGASDPAGAGTEDIILEEEA
jgi:hypothetical protein